MIMVQLVGRFLGHLLHLFSKKEAISTVIRPFLCLFGVIIPHIMEAYMQRPKGNPAVRLYRLPGFLPLLRNVPGSVRKAPVPLQILQDSLLGWL